MTILIVVCMGFISRHIHNGLIDEEHLLHIAHGKLEVEMQRRHDAVMECLGAVEKYRLTEGKLLERLVALNGLAMTNRNAGVKLREKDEITALIQELDMIKERYPSLKSKGPYAYLMEVIRESGWRVARERLNYNERVYEYNIMCRIFPYGIFALLFGFKEEHFLRGPAMTYTYSRA